MKKLFWEDAYLSECDASVVKVNGDKIVLDQTIAYAFSGGQDRDYGTIGDYEILEAELIGNEIEYTIAIDHTLKVGDQVHLSIDWDRRYRLMRLHFLGDIVLQMILKRYPDLERIGAHVGENKSRIDFIMDFNIRDMFDDLMEELNEIIVQDYPIELAFEDDENQVRYWKMNGFSEHCGGTHIKSTGEIGKAEFKRRKLGKGKERIEILLVEA